MQFDSILSPTIPLTIVAEGAFLFLWSRIKTHRRKKFPFRLLILTIANLLTQLLLITTLIYSPFSYWPTLLTMEILVILMEAWALSQTGISRSESLKLSLLLNLVSFGLGLFLPI